jgi:hypothetical protein
MTIRAKETFLGIPFRRTVLSNGAVEPIDVIEGDMATDQITDHVLKDIIVINKDVIHARDRDYSSREITRELPYIMSSINGENFGRRRYLVYRRTVEWKKD